MNYIAYAVHMNKIEIVGNGIDAMMLLADCKIKYPGLGISVHREGTKKPDIRRGLILCGIIPRMTVKERLDNVKALKNAGFRKAKK